jgi:hypothetical protein
MTNVNSGVRVRDVVRDADTFANLDTHSIGIVRSGEGIDFWADQLPDRVVPDDPELV